MFIVGPRIGTNIEHHSRPRTIAWGLFILEDYPFSLLLEPFSALLSVYAWFEKRKDKRDLSRVSIACVTSAVAMASSFRCRSFWRSCFASRRCVLFNDKCRSIPCLARLKEMNSSWESFEQPSFRVSPFARRVRLTFWFFPLLLLHHDVNLWTATRSQSIMACPACRCSTEIRVMFVE